MAKDNGIVNIHGKEYKTVAGRVNEFREKYAFKYSIETDLVDRDEKTVVVKALIRDLDTDKVIATGYAEENRAASQINKTSATENCETSAIGRALAAFGLAGTEYASADEVAQAISEQGSQPTTRSLDFGKKLQGSASMKQRQTISDNLERLGVAKEDQSGYLIEQYGVNLPLTKEAASFVIEDLFEAKGYKRKDDFVHPIS
jgi:hypothetical protein